MRALSTDEMEYLCSIPAAWYGWTQWTSHSWRGVTDPERYAEVRPRLSFAQLSAYLAEHPDAVTAWLLASADGHIAGEWYFRREGETFIVSRVSATDTESLEFGNPATAAATFILAVLDSHNATSGAE